MTTFTIEAATISGLAMSQSIEDDETGEPIPHPQFADRASIEVMLPPGVTLPRMPLGGVWRVTLEGGHDQPDHPAVLRTARQETTNV